MGDRRLWLIDAGYLFNARHSVAQGFKFNYAKLRKKLEESGEIWRAYYLNSTPSPPTDAQDDFHKWLRSAPPMGPKIITKLYEMKEERGDKSYCECCDEKVMLACPNTSKKAGVHRLCNQVQKGVDVGLATLALIHKDNYDTLILSSGDSDLLDAIEHLSENGKRIELAVFHLGVASELQSRADKIHWIDDFSAEVAQ
ncbi:MAG: NYN domain-containing protein [Deltaproteobacteria bacterium]|nr:MAG: NYN domain-containing protein [Deltaproteobacteria bacterium]